MLENNQPFSIRLNKRGLFEIFGEGVTGCLIIGNIEQSVTLLEDAMKTNVGAVVIKVAESLLTTSKAGDVVDYVADAMKRLFTQKTGVVTIKPKEKNAKTV